MIFFPPNRHHADTEREHNEWNNFEKRSAPDRFFLQPENQKQRGRQRAGRRLGEEREQIKYERGNIENPAVLTRCIDMRDPSQQSEQKKGAHQEILQLRNPSDRFDLNRVHREDCPSQPCAWHFQACEDAPNEERIAKVKEDIYPVISRWI